MTGWWAAILAGTTVSPAMATTAPSAAATSQAIGGKVPPWTAALKRPKPRGMPRMAPGSAESTCAVTSPELTWRVRAPSARMIAEACRASITVAQVVKSAFRTARVTSMIVTTVSTCSSLLTTGSDSPPAVSAEAFDSLEFA